MTTIPRAAVLALAVTLLAAPFASAAELDRGAVDFIPPAELKWVKNAAGTNSTTAARCTSTGPRTRKW
jgi:hypothetical protein